MYQHENITLLNCDCMGYMATCERFDIGLVDPEYGIGEDGKKNHSRSVKAKSTQYTPKDWDKEPPPRHYFNQLFGITKDQIIFGANHFISRMPFDSPAWIVWNKENGDNDFADCELAWTSFKTAVRMFSFRWAGMLQGDMKNKEDRIHPTQKPVALYRWIIKNYVKPNQSILDTHGGSMSIAIAVHEANTVEKMNLKLVVCEKDTDYYNDAVKRFKNHIAQQKIDFPT